MALSDKPQIKALARNPLLLTIIAYLYTDIVDFVLPNSRAEFYSEVTDVLLNKWKGGHNQFKPAQKRLVLQHLALFNQDSGEIKDRRSIDLKTVLAQVKIVLPDLNLAEEMVEPLLDEIVERSGLLLTIDGGERYQFAHLTLQEFFAAAELRDKPKELLQRFQADPDIWRETVKLWCGLDHDSTDFIQAVYDIDSVTGLECLADATKISPELSDKIITSFKPKLGTEAINKAFAAVAAGSRGQAILDFLADTLVNAAESELRIAAANILSLTNIPKAAELLANCYVNRTKEVRPALVRLGDLAVIKLETLAKQGNINALNILQAIGTIQAVNKLVPFLWDGDINLASRAALNLASLSKSEVENVLREYPLTEKQRKKDWFKWVWEPFKEPASSSLPVIKGRIVYLINQIPKEKIVSFKEILNIDPRIIIPLVVQEQYKWKWIIKKTIIQQVVPKLFIELEDILEKIPSPTINDWKQMFVLSKYEFKNSLYYISLIIIFTSVSFIGLAKIIISIFSSTLEGKVLGLLMILSIVCSLSIVWKDRAKLNSWISVIVLTLTQVATNKLK